MTTAERLQALGLTPRLICREAAAEYCGVSPNQFDHHVDVQPILIGKRKLFDVRALDRWLDQRSGLVQPFVSNDQWLGALDGDPLEGH